MKKDVIIKGVLHRVRTRPEVFHGYVNHVAPHIIGYYQLSDAWLELAEGDGLDHKGMYIITVITHDKYLDLKRSSIFRDLSDAYNYIELLTYRTEHLM